MSIPVISDSVHPSPSPLSIKITDPRPWLQGNNMMDLKWLMGDYYFSFHWHSEYCQSEHKKLRELKLNILYKNIYAPIFFWPGKHILEILFLMRTDIW